MSCLFATHLHRHQPVIDQDLFGEEVGANCCFVACAELLVDLESPCKHVLTGVKRRDAEKGSLEGGRSYILVHQAGLAYPTVAEDNDLRELAGDTKSAVELQYLEENLLP